MTSASLTACPARLVPAARANTGMPCAAARATAAITSSAVRGMSTAWGRSWYRLASVL